MPASEKDFRALGKAIFDPNRDLAKVRKLAAKVPNADVQPYNLVGESMLTLAVRGGVPVEFLRVLVEDAGAKLDTASPKGTSPISVALELERADVIEYFASRGAKIKLVPFAELPQGEKDRRLATVCGEWYRDTCAPRMKKMLAEGADANGVVDGKTPLQRLVGQGDLVDLFRTLLDAGAKPDTVDADGDTLLHRTAHFGNSRATQMFLKAGVPVDVRDRQGRTPLHRAVSGGYPVDEVVSILLEGGADVTARDHEGKTPIDVANHVIKPKLMEVTAKPIAASTKALLAAVGESDPKRVAALLADGADPCALDTSSDRWGSNNVSGVAALHVAFTRGVGKEVVDLLLAHPKLDVNVRSVDNRTPLHVLVEYGRGPDRVARIRQLLAMGAAVDPVDDSGRTPIFGLTSFYQLDGELELFDLLVAAGADPKRADKSQETMLDRMAEVALQRFSGVHDKAGYVAMMTKLSGAGVPCRNAKAVATWLASKGARYGVGHEPSPTAVKPKPKPKPSKARRLYDKITGGRLASYAGKDTYVTLRGKRHPVALFDWFVLNDEQSDDKHEHVDAIRDYHITSDAEAKVDAEAWIPIGIVGMTGSLDSYAEIAVDGTLYLDLSKAKGGDAPLVLVMSDDDDGDEDRDDHAAESAVSMYRAVFDTLSQTE